MRLIDISSSDINPIARGKNTVIVDAIILKYEIVTYTYVNKCE